MNKPRILFVDDEPNILDGLRRLLYREKRVWDIEFAKSGAEALRMMGIQPFDIVVSDMRMPEMNGAELLSRITDEYPETIRFILSGHSEKSAIVKALPYTHQFLSKPCEAGELKEQINRSLSLWDRLSNELLRRMISGIDSLPCLPHLYQKIREISQSDEVGIREAADIISQDVGMSAKILHLVNSSFFSLSQEVSSVHQAVALLGIETLKSLIISIDLFKDFELTNSDTQFSIEDVANHGIACGSLARQIVFQETKNEVMAEHALTAGLLHDVGKLILVSECPDQFTDILNIAQEESRTIHSVELECDGITHADVGAYLLGLWHLPIPVTEAVALHHSPESIGLRTMTPALAVYVSNIIVQEQNPGTSGNCAVPTIDSVILSNPDLGNRIEQWRSIEMQGALIV